MTTMTLAEAARALLTEHNDIWFNASQPPNERDFGCICEHGKPLGHSVVDNYEEIHWDHIAEQIARMVAEAREVAWDEGYQRGIRDEVLGVWDAADNPYRSEAD